MIYPITANSVLDKERVTLMCSDKPAIFCKNSHQHQLAVHPMLPLLHRTISPLAVYRASTWQNGAHLAASLALQHLPNLLTGEIDPTLPACRMPPSPFLNRKTNTRPAAGSSD